MTQDREVYAIWEDIPAQTYTVTFNANGGTGTMAAVHNLTGTYTLPESTFTPPEGKRFSGWSLTSNGEIITTVEMDEDKEVYAIWEDIPMICHVVTDNNDLIAISAICFLILL
jgi:ribosomal silencing factor RsfS